MATRPSCGPRLPPLPQLSSPRSHNGSAFHIDCSSWFSYSLNTFVCALNRALRLLKQALVRPNLCARTCSQCGAWGADKSTHPGNRHLRATAPPQPPRPPGRPAARPWASTGLLSVTVEESVTSGILHRQVRPPAWGPAGLGRGSAGGRAVLLCGHLGCSQFGATHETSRSTRGQVCAGAHSLLLGRPPGAVLLR